MELTLCPDMKFFVQNCVCLLQALFLDLSKSSEIKPPLKKSSEQCLKVRENLAKTVFLSDSNNDLENLLTLDIEKLFEKYEEISKSKNLVTIQDLEETNERQGPSQQTVFFNQL